MISDERVAEYQREAENEVRRFSEAGSGVMFRASTLSVWADDLLDLLAAQQEAKRLREQFQDDVRTFEDAPNDSYAAGWRDAARAYLKAGEQK